MFGFFKDKFNNLKETVSNTAQVLVGNVVNSVSQEEEFSEFVLDDMEDMLISADLGVNYATELVDNLRGQTKVKPSEVKNYLKEEFLKTLKNAGSNDINYVENSVNIYFICGVNGVGKTTLIGKLAYKFKNQGKKVLIAAGDTFRAAAIEQLEIWADRSKCEIIKQKEGSDPAAVIYDAISAAKARHADVIICDTAGRLHNKKHLMDELAKINRVIDRELPDASKEKLLVLDATTGQNAVNQAEQFRQATGITGIVLTKLDGTAKGGVVLAIKDGLGIPVKYIGVGEQIDDLQPFNPDAFADALFSIKE